MNFIKKMIEEKKLKQEENFKKHCSRSILNVEKFIYVIKEHLLDLIDERKNITTEFIDDFKWDLQALEAYYEKFLYDLKGYEFAYKETYYKNVKRESKQKADYMHQLKKQYRKEFETIYNNFKRITKGCDFPRRNEILSKMRKAFDFDSAKYYAPDQYIIMR